MDDLDITQERMEAEEARRRAAFKPVEIPEGTGTCQWCGDSVLGAGRWCGPRCRDDDVKASRK